MRKCSKKSLFYELAKTAKRAKVIKVFILLEDYLLELLY